MPRIRSIKPEHWNDKFLPNISIGAHLLWIGMWNFSDDKGIIETDPYLLKSNIFPRRKEVKPVQIDRWVKELIKFGFVIPFKHKDTQYVIHRTFDVHQKIDKPQPSKVDSDTILRILDEYSKNRSLPFDERSPLYRIGEDKEGIGEDKEAETEFFNGDFLVPKMIKIFKTNFPNYPLDKDADSKACLRISENIAAAAGWQKSELSNGKMDETLKFWERIVLFGKSDTWYSGRSITDYQKEWQRLIQKINSAKNGTKQATGANVSTDSLLSKIAAMYSQT